MNQNYTHIINTFIIDKILNILWETARAVVNQVKRIHLHPNGSFKDIQIIACGRRY